MVEAAAVRAAAAKEVVAREGDGVAAAMAAAEVMVAAVGRWRWRRRRRRRWRGAGGGGMVEALVVGTEVVARAAEVKGR